MPVVLEPATALVEPVETGIPAAQPEVTAFVLENAVDFAAAAEPVAVLRPGDVMGDLPVLAIQSIEGAREEAYPQNAVGILVNRDDTAGGQTVGFRERCV